MKKVRFTYIYKRNGGYQILKDNVHYGWYDSLAWALYDRDRFEQTNWDWDLFLDLPDVPNPYEHMELPPFDSNNSYISHIPERWKVQKSIDGKIKYFGSYKTREEAEARVQELIENGWVK